MPDYHTNETNGPLDASYGPARVTVNRSILIVRRYLFLLRELVKRDFQGRYAGSVLGFVWSLVQPLWMLTLFTFVFSTVMKVTPVGARTGHFAIFLFGGLLPWTAMHEGVLRSATAITENAALVKKLRFPAEILVLAVVLAALLHEAIAAVIFVGALLVVGEFSWGGLPLLLVAVPLQIGLTLGLGLVVAALHVFFRDTAQILGMVFNVWFYLTPIVYPLALVPSRYRPWLELNPLTALVGLYRQAFLGGSPAVVPGAVTLALVAAVLTSAGFWLFRRLKPAFVDEI
jgi:lipopolysaccharide transport system permease protein